MKALIPKGRGGIVASAAGALAVSLALIFNPEQDVSIPIGDSTNPELEEISKLPKYDRPDLAVSQNLDMTREPSTNNVPVARTMRTLRQIKESTGNFRALENVNWSERGPNNVGGRTRALMFDPNDDSGSTVWAGGVAGGLWYNDNITSSSSQWQNVDDFWANLAISTIAYDPTETETFYVGTGEGFFNADAVRGAGIWKSTNGGNSWTQLSATDNSDFHYIQKLVVTPEGTIIVATREGLFRSTNGGTSFSELFAGRYADVEVASNGDIYASAGIFEDGIVRKSTNDGVSWTLVTPATGGQRIELAVAPSDSSVVYAVASIESNIAWFRRSTDGGNTWSTLNVPRYYSQSCGASSQDFARGQAWYDLIVQVHPTNPDIAIVGGIDLYKTTNGGSSWGLISYWTGRCDTYVHADQHAIQFSPVNDNAAIFGNDGGVFYSANVGNASNPTISARNNGYNVTQFYAADQINSTGSNIMLAGAQDNGSLRFNSSGINSTTEATGGDGAFCHIDQNDGRYQVTSYVYNVYYRSTNSGSSFRSILNNQSSGRFINPTEYDDNAKVLYGAANDNQYTRITNMTGSPSASVNNVNIGGFRVSALKASPHTNNRLFLGTGTNRGEGGSRIYRVDNANGSSPTVTQIGTSALPTNAYISSIDVGTTDDQIIITYSNYGVTSVWETRNGGTSWSNREGNLPDIPIRWVIYNPSNTNEVLLATELGVWSTDNVNTSSPEWGVTNTGLANVRCDMLQYRSSDGVVVVATHGRGVFTATPFGSGGGVDPDPDPVACSTTVDTFPYGESFENGDGWEQASGDDGDWVRTSEGTPSSNTGPSEAEDGSSYLFLEASSNGSTGQIGANATAILQSPCFDLEGLSTASFSFSYHMYGTDVGSLTLEASTDGSTWSSLWTESGNEGNQWNSGSVNLADYIGEESLRLRFVGVTGDGWSSDIAIDNLALTSGGADPDPDPSCPSIDFSSVSISSFSNQDSDGTNSVSSDGSTFVLTNNTWKSVAYDYTVTANTVIEFEFRSTSQGEIHGIAFEDDNELTADRVFKVHGTQSYGVTNYDNYSGSDWVTYSIPVGSFYTGSFDRLVFVNDNDGGSGNNSRFRNVIVHEGDCGNTQPIAQMAGDAQATNSLIPVMGTDPEFSFAFSSYPNPVSNVLNLSHGYESGSYTITSIGGAVVTSGAVDQSLKQIDTSDLTSGIYILKVNSAEGVIVKKFKKK